MDVYIVHAGEYSDRRVDAVFSSESKAEQYAMKKHLSEYECYDVEVVAVDEITMTPLVTAFVTFKEGDAVSGRVYTGSLYKGFQCKHTNLFVLARWPNKKKVEIKVVCGTGGNRDQALKSARDNRAKILAQDAGVS